MLPNKKMKPETFLAHLKKKPEQFWIKRGQQMALELFKEMAARIPAYKDFLKKEKIDPEKILSFNNLSSVTPTSKENYLLKYQIKDLCWDGEFDNKQWVLASTSGSTGKPYYFPRSIMHDKQFQFTAEMLFIDNFEIHKKSTLFVDCFALGIWIGGMFMYQALKYISDTGKYKMTIATPGAYKEEAIKAIKHLGAHFDQIVICGYAPLVKDLLDDGIAYGLDWKKYNIKFFFAAEAFSEAFRDHIMKKCGIEKPYDTSFNHYGTADLGTMSHETPLSILLRRLAWQKKSLHDAVFLDAAKMPTLTQFIPELYFFEEVNGNLICSSASGIPLVRYDLKDIGRVFTLEEAQKMCFVNGIDLMGAAKEGGIKEKIWQLPFVQVYERRDMTVNIYSVNIYPECIKRALETQNLERFITGKFAMRADYDQNQNQFLEINAELKEGSQDNEPLKKEILEAVIHRLNEENSEWRDFYANPKIRQKVTPKLNLLKYQDARLFKPGVKQKWVLK